jgi:hypothetical protein
MSSTSVADYTWELNLGRIQQRIPDAKAILARATVLRIGWEMDNEVCAVEMKDGSRMLVGTSHGGVYEIDIEDLKEDMANYEAALAQSKEVLSALG